jgi:methylamine dehydrogenase heavy chain
MTAYSTQTPLFSPAALTGLVTTSRSEPIGAAPRSIVCIARLDGADEALYCGPGEFRIRRATMLISYRGIPWQARPGTSSKMKATECQDHRRGNAATRYPRRGSAPGHTLAVLLLLASPLTALLPVAATHAEIEADETGQVFALPDMIGPHWVWVPDRILRHSILFDGDSGGVLGMLDTTWTLAGRLPHLARSRHEFYVLDPVYSRGHRGERRDFVTIYDARDLKVVGEIEIPPKTGEVGHGVGLTALTDDGRFLLAYNQDPSNSVSVVDLEARRFVAEIVTAGCALVYPTGPRGFGTLCDDGTALHVQLDDGGQAARLERTEPFFDPVTDPLTEKGARNGDHWLFASFEGHLHDVDFSESQPKLAARWPLFTEEERAAAWRIGGIQHLAVHEPTGRLYSVVHEGGPGTHKDPGSQIWVYDLKTRERVQVIEPETLLPAFIRPHLDIARDGWLYWALSIVLPNLGVHSVVVTQDDEPLLFVRNNDVGAVGVLDALSGEHLRELEETGISGAILGVP